MYRAAPRIVSCGSRLPGSVGTDSVAEPDGPLARCADEPIAVVVRDRRAATAATTRNTYLRIADLLSTLRKRLREWDVFQTRKLCSVLAERIVATDKNPRRASCGATSRLADFRRRARAEVEVCLARRQLVERQRRPCL